MNNGWTSWPDLRRNFSLMVLNGIAFRAIDTLVSPSLVLTVFLSQLTDNPVILGMPMALWSGGFMLSQLWVSGTIQRLALVLPFYRTVSVFRILIWLVLVLGTAFLTDSVALIVVLFIFLLIYPLLWGMAGMAFFEVVGKTVPPRMRGLLYSWRLALGGLVALAAGWLVNRALMEDFPLAFPRNFALLFGMAALSTLLGVLSMQFVREPAGQVQMVPGGGLRERWREIRTVWQSDRLFRHYILGRIALLLAAGTAPLIIVYAQARFSLPLNAAAIFLIADTITGLVTVAVSGWLSARIGDQRLAALAAGLGVAVFVLILAAGWASPTGDLAFAWFLLVFILLAAHNSASTISFTALTLNIPPEERRPLYIGLSNTIFGLASYLSIGQGMLVGMIGYAGLFGLAGILAALGLWQVVAYLQEPTDRQPAAYGQV